MSEGAIRSHFHSNVLFTFDPISSIEPTAPCLAVRENTVAFEMSSLEFAFVFGSIGKDTFAVAVAHVVLPRPHKDALVGIRHDSIDGLAVLVLSLKGPSIFKVYPPDLGSSSERLAR